MIQDNCREVLALLVEFLRIRVPVYMISDYLVIITSETGHIPDYPFLQILQLFLLLRVDVAEFRQNVFRYAII